LPDRAPLVVWIVTDGKPGHENQSRGLAEALARAGGAVIRDLPALPPLRAGLAWLTKRLPADTLPAPDLILGAGHATHLTLLALRRATGGRAVVLMRPSLPRRWFDLCILPRHDGTDADASTLVTEGALNRVCPAPERDPHRGLFLIGGTSPHFAWDSGAVRSQIEAVLERTPETRWTLTTSRRTPGDFLPQLREAPSLTVVPHTVTSPTWLPERLAENGVVWVTPDSASMVFEALTSGADVGIFDLAANPRSRVARATGQLAEDGRVTGFAHWRERGTLLPNVHPLAEADRCAGWILEWLKRGD
jgi:uncharacterized protein